MATEIGGMIYGKYAGSVKDMSPGGLSCENSYMAHGESYEAFKKATTASLEPILAGEGSLGMCYDFSVMANVAKSSAGFMLHLSSHFSITEFAMERHPDLKCKSPQRYVHKFIH